MNIFRSNRPLGITLISIYFVIIGTMTLLASITQALNLTILFKMLESSNMPVFLFLLTNLLLPLIMVACAIALFNKKSWGWLGIVSFCVLNILVYIFLPLVHFGPSSFIDTVQHAWVIAIPIISLIYLTKNKTMLAYDFSGASRKHAYISASVIASLFTTIIIVLSPNPLRHQISSNNLINTDRADGRPINQAVRSPTGY